MRACALFGVLVFARVLALASVPSPDSFWVVPAFVFHDAAVALGFWILDRLARRSRWMWMPYGAVVLLVAIDVPVVRALSSPLTVPMLRAAGGPLLDSIAYYATVANLARIAVVIVAAVLLPAAIAAAPRRLRVAAVAAILGLAALGPMAIVRVETRGLHRNGVTALLATARPRVAARAADADWRASPFESSAGEDLLHLRGTAAGRNVLMVVLESAGARYLAPYGAADDPMPTLTALAREAVVFEHAYAAYPESIKGLFAMLCARDPAFDVPAEAHAEASCDALPGALRAAGYRTAVFHSGRFAYLGMQPIVERMGFDVREDAGAIGGNVQSSFGVDEPAAVARILAWLDALPPGQRFFVNYLPVAGHHPYAAHGPAPYQGGDDLTAYRNALYDGDRALGVLLAGLRARGLAEQTLVIVVGDHGEAFGQHPGNFGHTQFIYEENVKVPLIIAGVGSTGSSGSSGSPGSSGSSGSSGSTGSRVSRVASVIDIAPTILDLLGLPAQPRHEGGSLLEPRGRMALFFTDYALGWLGLRDGCWKFMHAIETTRSQLFDVCSDPDERTDLSGSEPVRVRAYRARVQTWSSATRASILKR